MIQYKGIGKNTFQADFFFSQVFSTHFAHLFCNMYEMFGKYLCGNHDYAKSKKEADFVLKKVRRLKIIFWRSGSVFLMEPFPL